MFEPSQPILTHLLAQEWASKPDKPTARGTQFRYSSAHDCARKMAYQAIGADKTNPMDEGDAWSPGIGTLLHEAAQAAILRVYPNAAFEFSSSLGLASGSCDCLVPAWDIEVTTGEILGGTHVLWEYKSMGEYGFDKQVGWARAKSAFKEPAGPALKAIAQAGMNALAIERENLAFRIETILMGSVCVSPLAKRKAGAMRTRGFARVGAEFRIERDIWEPLAAEEYIRITSIANEVEDGFLPARIAVDEDNREVELNPLGGRREDWLCDYCPFYERCLKDGHSKTLEVKGAV